MFWEFSLNVHNLHLPLYQAGSNESIESTMSCEFSLILHNLQLPLDLVRSNRIPWIHWIIHGLGTESMQFNSATISRMIQWIYWIYHILRSFTESYNLPLPLGLVRSNRIQWIHWFYHVLGTLTESTQSIPTSGSSKMQQDPLNLPSSVIFYWILQSTPCIWIQ